MRPSEDQSLTRTIGSSTPLGRTTRFSSAIAAGSPDTIELRRWGSITLAAINSVTRRASRIDSCWPARRNAYPAASATSSTAISPEAANCSSSRVSDAVRINCGYVRVPLFGSAPPRGRARSLWNTPGRDQTAHLLVRSVTHSPGAAQSGFGPRSSFSVEGSRRHVDAPRAARADEEPVLVGDREARGRGDEVRHLVRPRRDRAREDGRLVPALALDLGGRRRGTVRVHARLVPLCAADRLCHAQRQSPGSALVAARPGRCP